MLGRCAHCHYFRPTAPASKPVTRERKLLAKSVSLPGRLQTFELGFSVRRVINMTQNEISIRFLFSAGYRHRTQRLNGARE